MENEDDDPVGCPPPRDPIAEFQLAALEAGAVAVGEVLSPTLVAFAFRLTERCACIAEGYGDADDSAADAIRAQLGDH